MSPERPLASIEEIIAEARAGRMFILVDDENRENEGDLIIPAEACDADAVNFMAKHGRGLICLSLDGPRVEALGLPLMAARNLSRHSNLMSMVAACITSRPTSRIPFTIGARNEQ